MNYLGIDPGQKGGVAVIPDGDLSRAQAWRMPKDEIALAQLLLELFSQNGGGYALAIEKVASRPGQGVASTFKFGRNYGTCIGCLAMLNLTHHLAYTFVTPRKWQQKVFDANVQGESTKEKSLYVARRLFPQVDLRYKADDGKADALLIALWLCRQEKQ